MANRKRAILKTKNIILSALLVMGLFFLSRESRAWTITSDFESGTIGQPAQGASGFGVAGTNTTYSNTRAHTGTKSAQMYWQLGNEGFAVDHGEYGIENITSGHEFWCRVYYYFPTGFNFYTPTYSKVLRFHVATSGGGNVGYHSILFDGSGNIIYNSEVASFNIPIGQSYGTGSWVCMEMYIKFSNTSPVMRVWRNGTLIAQDTTHPTLSSSSDVCDLVYVMSTWNGGSPVNQYEYIDDVVLTTDTPSNRDAASNPMIGPTGSLPPDTQDPSVPSNVNASVFSSTQINLSWSASTDNVGVTGYKIYRNGTYLATTPNIAYQNTGLSPSTTYTYRVSALDAATNESAQSVQVQATTQAPSSTITLGETTILSSTESGMANYVAAQSVLLSQSATLKSLSIYVENASGQLRLGVYDATGPGGGPGQKQAETAEITPVSGWNTANVTTSAVLAPGTYWLAFLPSNDSLSLRFETSGSFKYYTYAYGALPVTFSTSPESMTYHCSFYATFDTGSDAAAPAVPKGLEVH